MKRPKNERYRKANIPMGFEVRNGLLVFDIGLYWEQLNGQK